MIERPVLFLDLGRTTGWAEGVPGERPTFGSIKFASDDASREEVFGEAMKWFAQRWSAFKPKTVVYEAPIAPFMRQGTTNRATTMVLFGLPAIVGGVANRMGVYDVREAHVDDVRRYVVGKRLVKADNPKRVVIGRLQSLGYSVNQHDAADALAGWLFACSVVSPKRARLELPLFDGVRG